jgi:ABC-type antimicrobial peptide transport system permease subunit
MRLFMGRATLLFVPGLFLGLIGSMSAAGLTRSRVYGISALSPTYLAAAGVIMLLVGVAATAIPVVRATRVDPLEALRAE